MDGPRSRGYGARSGYDVRTRCIRGCTERRQGVSPGRIRHETETARFCVSFRLLLAVTVFLPTGLIVKAQLKNVEKTRFIILILGAHLLLEAITV